MQHIKTEIKNRSPCLEQGNTSVIKSKKNQFKRVTQKIIKKIAH